MIKGTSTGKAAWGFALLFVVLCVGFGPGSLSAQTTGKRFTEKELDNNPKLTPGLRKLILAYENYIGMYPTDKKSVAYLIDAAGRFRDMGDDKTGISVFERVLSQKALNRKDRAYTHFQIMEAYKNLGNHAARKAWAHRLARADVEREDQLKAKQFIFSAGNDEAKALQDAGKFDEAGDAYARLAVMNPDHESAPDAMLVAARMFEQADKKGKAAQTYERFYYTYPDYKDASGGTALDALEGAAALYGELGDYRHTADAVERILTAKPEHKKRKLYLNNLASIYSLLKDHNNAIRVRQTFIASYPKDAKAGGYLWDIARLRGAAGQRRAQLKEFERFITQYPGDVRAIEANYLVGVDRMTGRQKAIEKAESVEAERLLALARPRFERAISLHDSLEAKKEQSGDLKHGLASALQVAKMDSANYYAISWIGSSNFSADSVKKKKAMERASRMYVKIASFPYIPTRYEAFYKRGQLFEDFSREYLRQPRPDTAITYDQISRVFAINAVAEGFLRLAMDNVYRKQIVSAYETKKGLIDSIAASDPDITKQKAHTYWIQRTRDRLRVIPRVVDSLRFNTIGYEADLLVADARVKIPERLNNAWPKFQATQRELYRKDPRLEYGHRMQVFDRYLAPMVYGKDSTDTTSMVSRFRKLITDGQRLDAPEAWVSYNRGRLRLVYAARSNFFRVVADGGVGGLRQQVADQDRTSDRVRIIIEGLPQLDLSVIKRPVTPKPLKLPKQPVIPRDLKAWMKAGGDVKALAARVKKFKKDVKWRIANHKWLLHLYKKNSKKYVEKLRKLRDDHQARNKVVYGRAKTQVQEFMATTRKTQQYRYYIAGLLTKTASALERDVVFGYRVGYSDRDKRAVRDSALYNAIRSAEQTDSIFRDVQALRFAYQARRDSSKEGSPKFVFLNYLVQPYASMADSFRSTAINRYLHVYEGRDSLYNVGLEHEVVQRALVRLKQLDPTFGHRMVPVMFTFVTEDSTALWKATSQIDKKKPNAWKAPGFDDSKWLPAVKGGMPGGLIGPMGADAVATVVPDTSATTAAIPDSLAGDSIYAAPVAVVAPPRERIDGFPETGNLNMRDIWSTDGGDTVYFRYSLALPPSFSELPDSLRERTTPRPLIRKVTITITADDDYVVYVNGQNTTVRDGRRNPDWKQAHTYELLKDQFFIGDTVNVIAVFARNEDNQRFFPHADRTTFGMMARIEVEMGIPLDIYELLYKPPEPEPVFAFLLTHADSMMLADTTKRHFRTPLERDNWLTCRRTTLRATWMDSVLTPWRVRKSQEQVTKLDTQVVQLRRWLLAEARMAQQRIAEAAGRAIGVEDEPDVDAGGETAPGGAPGGTEEFESSGGDPTDPGGAEYAPSGMGDRAGDRMDRARSTGDR
jgi:tetratricopeptide (TPR) repeat protein